MPKIPPAINGGTTYPGGKRKGGVPKAASSVMPPLFTYNPTVSEEGQRALTAEGNRLHEIEREKHFNKTDLRLGLRNTRTEGKRNRADVGKNFRRGAAGIQRDLRHGNEGLERNRRHSEEGLGNKEADLKQGAERRLADYQTRKNNITREFGELGHKQAEAMNATGVLDKGTSAAAAAARARNQQVAEAPIVTEEARTKEDLATQLGRIATARRQLGEETNRELAEHGQEAQRGLGEITEDRDTSLSRLKQDLGTEREELHRRIGRSEHKLGDTEQEVLQAGTEAKANAHTNAIWEFKSEHPAAFAKWARQHPNAAAPYMGKRPKGDDGELSDVLTTPISSKNGGTQAPSGNHRRRKKNNHRHKRRRRKH